MLHALDAVPGYGAVVLLQPTSPLRTAEDIAEAWRLFLDNEPCEVVSVSPVGPESWTGHVRPDGQFERIRGFYLAASTLATAVPGVAEASGTCWA